jgi:hypothetical protein
MTTLLRLAVAAAPALLADSLRAVLADTRTEVSILLAPSSRSFDVAIVAPGCDIEVDAPVTIVLDDASTSRGGGTVSAAGRDPQVLPDLASVVRYVRGLHTVEAPVGAHPER